MKLKYILIITIFLTVIIFSTITLANSINFKDVPNNAWYTNAVNNVANKNLMVGYNDYFRPNDNITRAEVAQLITNIINNNIFNYENDVINSVVNTMPSIVYITNGVVAGSGVIVSYNYILTSRHIVEGYNEFTVSFVNGYSCAGIVDTVSSSSDLALIRMFPMYEIKFNKLSLANKISLGETAIAIGCPRNFNFTVTKGVISQTDRLIDDNYYIQFDAHISPGNSGGAVINIKGELVGIVSKKVIQEGFEGLAFAVPYKDIKKFLNENAIY